MFLLMVSILISIGFYTLLERKILSLSQIRLGPNKTLIWGLIQPILDGLKLMKKMIIMNMNLFFLLNVMSSFTMFLLSMMLWISFPFLIFSNKILSLMWMLLMFGLLSYGILMTGWSSSGKYSYLGSIRSLAQSLSFEIMVTLFLVMMFSLKNKFSIPLFKETYNSLTYLSILTFFILSILECQRSPMDLAEGESELVSGYNTELSSIIFIFVFLGEYNSMIFFMLLLVLMMSKLNLVLMLLTLMVMILIRSCFPRIRYDHLMNLCWFKITPILISMWFYYMMFKFLYT